ncbi:hypothetical protein [Nocardioides euryhalodurans]|uniref:Fenitrothion hydrolase n=1 Tax=Nocardioides euryhalodurans TaxID=2518370 RepID=A0A4P7GP17_9ACTN|nr:hypothetical protein [Nocardioides euryhalodurans]QBR93719.1 hypothetical protein EXE57_16645 [Nocardioides euryhalodurans]
MDDDLTLAHGLGGPADLPIPPELAIAGAVAALVVSFTVLAVAWRKPRYDEATSGRPAPAWLARVVDSPGFRIGLRAFGLLAAAYVAVAAVLGPDLLTNPVFGIFYVWWWVGLVPASVLLGPVWRAISPVRSINAGFARLTGSDPDRGLYDYPARLGYWPAALGLLAFVWLELVYPYSTELGPVRLWLAVYVALMLLGGALFGSSFYERGDPFEVYSSLCAKLSVWGRRDGLLVVRSPLANLDTVRVRPGLVAVVGVLFGSTAFDSFRESIAFLRFVQESSASATTIGTLTLVGFCAGVSLVLVAGSMATGVAPGTDRRQLPGLFAHSVVPIVVGYIVAHYLNYFVALGWQTLIDVSDPLGTGANLLGTADLAPITWLGSNQTLLASLKVAAVVLGHVVGVVAAHDRAIKVLPPRHQLTGQLPMLAAMIAFTVGGLYLLFAA